MKKRTTLLIILIFLSLLPFVSYMIGGDLVLHTNIRYSLDPSSFIKDSIHAWSDDNFGRASGSGFTNIIQSAWFLAARSLFWFRPEIVQALILGIFNLIGAIGFILFVRNHFREKIGMLPMLIGSIFFLFNGYTLTYVASAPNFAIIYLIMPWQLFLFERCLQKETTRERLLPIVLLAFVNQLALWVNLVYFFMVFFVQLFLGILYVVRSETSVAKLISVKILVWIISIAMMSWWLLPQIYGGYADPVSSANTLSSEGFYNGDSGPLNIFRNLGYWGFFSGSNGEPYYDFSKFYRSGIMVLVTMIPIMLLIAGLLLERVRKNTQYLAWLSLLFLIFPFVGGINSNWPTAELMRWCFDNIPMFSIFRNTHKWMALVVLAESILMVFLCHNIIGKNDRAGKLFSVAAIVILVAGAWPFFSGRVIQPATVIEKIPDDWTRIADVINQDESIDRLMLLPDQYGEVYDWQGTRTKIPGSLGGALFATPVVHSTCKGCLPAYSEHLVNFVYKSFGEKDHDKFIGQLGISHILQRDDYAYEYYHKQSPKEIRDMLSIYPSIELGTSSGNLALFKVDEKLVNPKIYSPAALTVADSLDTYLDSLGFAYQTRQSFYIASSTLNRESKDRENMIDRYANYQGKFFSMMDAPVVVGDRLDHDLRLPAKTDYTVQAYADEARVRINYSRVGDDLVLEVETKPYDIRLDGKELFSDSAQGRLMIPRLLEHDTFIKIGENGAAILMTTTASSGVLPDLGDIAIADQALPVFRYQINNSSENFLENGDFSKGLWQAKVSNCRKSKEDAAIGMELRSEQGDTQRQYLSLWAKDDSACTASGAVADFDRDSTYLISLDYRRVSGSNPLICVWDGRKCAVRKDLIAKDNDWHSTSMLYKPEKNSGRFELYLYADKGAFDETVSDYSNVSIKKVDGGWLPVGQIKNPFDAGKTLVELAEGEHRLSTAALPLSDNLFREGSFESASLGTVAANCKKQSDDARLELNYVADATAGKYSIELAGDKDRACISSGMIDVSARGDSYFISYDYKIVEGEKAQICVWDGKECIYNKISMGSGSGWNHVGEAFRAETQPASISIYLYSPDQKGPGRVRYDNVIVRSFDSSILDSYRVYSEKEQELEVLDFEYVKISPIHYVLNFSKLPEKESLLVFQETFHPDWQLECGRDGKAMGWWDKMNVPSCTVGGETHFVANGFANGWFLDREALDEVKVKKDGSFSLDLRFTLNRWFYIGLAVSGFTFLFALALLFYASLKFFRPRQDKKVSEKYAQRD